MEPAPPEPETPGGASEPPEPAPGNTAVDNTGSEEEITEMKMAVQIGESVFTATLEDNAAVDALVEMTWEPVIRGIAVVCEGADDVTVNAQITQAVSVLTGVSTNRISISKMS